MARPPIMARAAVLLPSALLLLSHASCAVTLSFEAGEGIFDGLELAGTTIFIDGAACTDVDVVEDADDTAAASSGAGTSTLVCSLPPTPAPTAIPNAAKDEGTLVWAGVMARPTQISSINALRH